MRVTNAIPLGCSLLLPVGTVNPVEAVDASSASALMLLSSSSFCSLCLGVDVAPVIDLLFFVFSG